MRPRGIAILAAVLALVPAAASAHPEFQAWSQTTSERFVNCAMCHAHPDGPEGMKAGQIGSLTAEQLRLLNGARGAFEPGGDVRSPILNEFGNSILSRLGRREVIALRPHPADLAPKLDPLSDIDGDGLPDEREYREGTDPLDAQSGNPWALFRINLVRQRFHILMVALATICGLYGLHNLLHGLHRLAGRPARKAIR